MRLVALLCLLAASAWSAELVWDKNPEPEVAGYRVYMGQSNRLYTFTADTTNTSWVVTNAVLGTNYFAVTAFTVEDLESDFSDEVFWVRRLSKPQGVRIPDIVATVEGAPSATGPWTEEAELARIKIPTSGVRFYRSRLEMGSDTNVVFASAEPSKAKKVLRFDASKTGKL